MSQILQLTRNLCGKALFQMHSQRASDSLFTCIACQRLRNVYSTQAKLKPKPVRPKKAKWRIKKEKKKALEMYISLQESIHGKQSQITPLSGNQSVSHQADLKVPRETLENLNKHHDQVASLSGNQNVSHQADLKVAHETLENSKEHHDLVASLPSNQNATNQADLKVAYETLENSKEHHEQVASLPSNQNASNQADLKVPRETLENLNQHHDQVASLPGNQNFSHQAGLKVPHETLENLNKHRDQVASQPGNQNLFHQADLKVPLETLEILNVHIEKLTAEKLDSMKANQSDSSITADTGVSVKKQKMPKIFQKDKEKLDVSVEKQNVPKIIQKDKEKLNVKSQTNMSSDVINKPNNKQKAKAVIKTNFVGDKIVHRHRNDNAHIKEMWSNGETEQQSLQEKGKDDQVVPKMLRQKKESKKKLKKPDQKVISKAAYVKNTDIGKAPSVQKESVTSLNNTDMETVQNIDTINDKKKVKHKNKKTTDSNEQVIPEIGSKPAVTEKAAVTDKNSPAISKKDKKFPSKKTVEKLENLDVKGSRQVFNEDLRSYVDACCYIGEVTKAYEGIKFYRSQVRHGIEQFQITDVEIYNILIQALAEKGMMYRDEYLQRLLSTMAEDGVQPNLQTHAMSLYVLAQRKTKDRLIAQSIVDDMKAGGFDVNDIFTKLALVDKERQGILQVLRWLDPKYEPPRHEEPHTYRGPLVEGLNDPLPKSEMVEANPYIGITTAEEIVKKADIQFHRELENFVHVEPITKVADDGVPDKQKKQTQEKLKRMRQKWRQDMTKAFRAKVLKMKKEFESKKKMSLYPFFKLLPEEVYIDLLLKEIEYLGVINEHYSPASHMVYKDLSQKVCNRFRIQLMADNNRIPKLKTLFKKYTEETMDPNLDKLNHRTTWLKIQNEVMNGLPLIVDEKHWSPFIKKALGKELYEIIFSAVKVPSKLNVKAGHVRMVPAFFTVIRQKELEMEEQIKPHPEYMKLLSCENNLMFHTSELPLLVPSLPWVTPTQGGNFFSTGKTIRWHIPRQMAMFKESSDTGPVLDSLNILGACPWKVNKPILDLIIQIFNQGGDNSLDIPILPASIKKPQKPKGDLSKEEKVKYYTANMAYHKHYSEENSLWYHALYKFSIANMFRDEIFWFPHSMDFRGRTYAVPPHFNHLCGDTARAIIKFAKEKPLGPDGLDWLKIHLINMTGLKKKCSNAERLEYANEIMPKILDSADRPLEGERWWTTSEDPWQSLACCMEIANASRSEDPAKFLSGYPVHQDGSCNGLQHYAALGRDTAGAKSVNLYPFDKPSDVYQEVVDLVELKRQEDVKSGNAKVREAAKICEGHVERKVIKQTIMTTVYGVTEYGARLQIARQLKERGMPRKQIMIAKCYLATSTFECLQQMFSSAKQIQDWFNACAVNICSISNKSVEWVTPLNFPVVQPYFRHLRASSSGVMITSSMHESQFPNIMKQKNAFAPNYVHSLDSAHMMLTSLYCLRAGITFVSVHDCFWTHPCDVKVLNKVTREQFVSLHSQPILENLSKYFVKTFYKGPAVETSQPELTCELEDTDLEASKSDIFSYIRLQDLTNKQLPEAQRMEKLRRVLASVPERGDFDLEKVLESTYFFS